MTTFKKKTNKKKLSTLVKQQLPEFVLSDHPKFTEFVSSYFLFLESAELNLESITDVDNILLETQTDLSNFVLLDRTDIFGLDEGDKVVNEENTFSGSFAKNEVITGATSMQLQQFLQKIKEKIQDYSFLQIMLLLQVKL